MWEASLQKLFGYRVLQSGIEHASPPPKAGGSGRLLASAHVVPVGKRGADGKNVLGLRAVSAPSFGAERNNLSPGTVRIVLLLFACSFDQRGTVYRGRVGVPGVARVPNGGVKIEPIELSDAKNLDVEDGVPDAAVEARRVYFSPHCSAGLFKDICPGVCLLLVSAVERVPARAACCVIDSAWHAALR